MSISLLAAALVAAPYITPDDYYDVADGTDDAPSIRRALASTECASGCLVQFENRHYNLNSADPNAPGYAVLVCDPVAFRGTSGSGDRVRVKLHTTLGLGAFRVKHDEECDGIGTGGEGSSFDRLGFQEDNTPVITNGRAGIYTTARITLEHNFFKGYRHGFHAECSHTETPAQDCSSLYAADNWFQFSDHAAIYVQGADANGGMFNANVSTHACDRAHELADVVGQGGDTEIEEDEEDSYMTLVGTSSDAVCASFYDSSFLGSVWQGNMVHQSGDSGEFPSYISDNVNQRSTYLGNYSENSAQDEFKGNSFAAGGYQSFTGGGLIIAPGGKIHNANIFSPTITGSFEDADNYRLFRIEANYGSGNWWVGDYRISRDKLKVKWKGLNSKTVMEWNAF